jgi:hypothetical protein
MDGDSRQTVLSEERMLFFRSFEAEEFLIPNRK